MRMHNFKKLSKHIGLATIIAFTCNGMAFAQSSEVTFNLMPIRFINVKGDVNKFQQYTGMKAGSSSGINQLDIDAKPAKDIHVSFEGSMNPKENDYNGSLLITKDEVGFIKVAYKSLRRYYDGRGGWAQLVNNSTATPESYGLTQDLKKDVSWFNIDIGNKTPDESNVWLSYERMTKNGNQDSLTWNSVYESATSGMTKPYKKLAPSLFNTDQNTNTLSLNEKADLPARVTVKAKQSYEFVDGLNKRTEQQFTYSTDPTAADSKIRQQIDDNQTKLITSSVRAERWSLNDQTFVAAGYLFAHSKVNQVESLREYTANWVETGYSNPKLIQGYALAQEDKNTWTAQLLTELFPSLSFITKFKAELVSRSSESDSYTDSYSGGASHTFSPTYDLIARTESKTTKTGETISLRYSGIAKTSLYADLDLEQTRDWISQYQYRTNTGTTPISFDGNNNTPKMTTTIGTRFSPITAVTVTSDFKHKDTNQKYSTNYNVAPTAEYFFNKLQTITDEFNQKLSWKPFKWLQNSVAYKFANNNYHTQLVGQDWQKTQGNERDVNYDLTIQPNDTWMFNVGYSLQLLKASTPAAQQNPNLSTQIYIPPFTGNVSSIMFTTSYAPTDTLNVFTAVDFSRAKNANNNESVVGGALLYGVNNVWWDITTGLNWNATKNLTISPHYAYYSFKAYQSIETGNYTANVFWLDAKYKF